MNVYLLALFVARSMFSLFLTMARDRQSPDQTRAYLRQRLTSLHMILFVECVLSTDRYTALKK